MVGRSPPDERAETGSGAALGPGREQDTSLPPSQPYQVLPSIILFLYIYIDACQCRATVHTVSVFLAVSNKINLFYVLVVSLRNGRISFFHYVSGTQLYFIFIYLLMLASAALKLHSPRRRKECISYLSFWLCQKRNRSPALF